MITPALPTVIRDPIHDIIPFDDNDEDRLLLTLINTREFQRLRRIKQLGMAEMVFPAANHSRFAHSIGVMHNARRFAKAILKAGAKLEPLQHTAVLAAALLHDVGHGPFSHAFEKVTGDKHEGRTREIILSNETEVHQALKAHDASLPQLIGNFFDESLDDTEIDKAGIPPFASQIVSSQLDADRADFLLRDSYATGTDYGYYDLNWLIRSLKFHDGKIIVGRKAQSTVEQYIFARYHMYLRCYFHKTARAAEVMLKHTFARFKTLVTEYGPDEAVEFAPGINPLLPKVFSTGERISLADYQKLDDGSVTEFFRCCTESPDVTLRYLAHGILNRRLYKVIDATDVDADVVGDLRVKVAEAIKANGKLLDEGFEGDYTWLADTIKDTPYKPYSPGEKRQSQIHIEATGGGEAELSTASPRVSSLTLKHDLLRYFYPAELRDVLKPIAKDVLKGAN